MDKKKTAILVDGGFLEKTIFRKHKLEIQEVYNYAKKFIEPEEDLFRIYYYDCFPYDTTVELPISKTQKNYAETP
ncbi:MAG: NYN domain-containing protein, partial [Candidatus Margulisiibacteriota bacterium]